jgi:hypothetical protein
MLILLPPPSSLLSPPPISSQFLHSLPQGPTKQSLPPSSSSSFILLLFFFLLRLLTFNLAHNWQSNGKPAGTLPGARFIALWNGLYDWLKEINDDEEEEGRKNEVDEAGA